MSLGLKLNATSVSFEIFLSSAQKTLSPSLPTRFSIHRIWELKRQSREDQGLVANGLQGFSQQNGNGATNYHYFSSLNTRLPGLLVRTEYSTISISCLLWV